VRHRTVAARQASYPSMAATNPAARAAFPKRTLTNYFTQALDEGPERPAVELFIRSGGVLVTAHSLITMLEVAISLIVGFALGYGVDLLPGVALAVCPPGPARSNSVQ
jgi:hypothetical protein